MANENSLSIDDININDSDDQLYHQFLRGDVSSYDQLMIRYGDSVTFYINGYTNNLRDGEDLMIEAFARIMVKKPFIQKGAFKAYLYKTARNLALRFCEKRKGVIVFGLEELNKELSDSMLNDAAGNDSEREAILHMCLERIDPELKEALWLVYCDELTYAQAAEVMHVSVKRIDHLLSRGKEHMRRELRKEGISNAYK